MKNLLIGFAALSLAPLSFGAIDLVPDLPIFPKTVENLDLDSYLGRWYEVASTKPFFQRDCTCVTADYSLKEDGKVGVVNSCREKSPEGRLNQFVATADTTDEPGKFSVSAFNIPQLFSNYWVVDLAEDYRYAVVSTATRNPIWILSRTPEIAADDLQGIKERLKENGFKLDSLTPTFQGASCPANPEVK